MTPVDFCITTNPVISRLNINNLFKTLSPQQQLYAHHLSQAAWAGARIILRQVSPESNDIFDLLVALHRLCSGRWETLLDSTDGSSEVQAELKSFLLYAAVFLSNVGNYYGEGDQKIIPKVSAEFVISISSGSKRTRELCRACLKPMLSDEPNSLGYPSDHTQSGYYPGPLVITKDEIAQVGSLMDKQAIEHQNTRISKNQRSWWMIMHETYFDVLQASFETDAKVPVIGRLKSSDVRLIRGDHSADLERVNSHLAAASECAGLGLRKDFLEHYRTSFQTGNLAHHREAQRLWVEDKQPPVETYFGFIETYRDPFGTRAEFEGFVAIPDIKESQRLHKLVHNAQKYIATLPWVVGAGNRCGDVNGPFELNKYIAPEFDALHALAYCSTNLFLGLNLPEYEDIREAVGHKNFMIRNRDQALEPGAPSVAESAHFIDPSEKLTYLQHIDSSVTVKVTIHELFGHGTGKLLAEDKSGKFNFDPKDPPVNPLTGRPIDSWYKPGQNFSSVFGEMAKALEECRAECAGAFLAFERSILETLGYDDDSLTTADDLVYNLYLAFGELGLSGLESYNPRNNQWGQAHDRARFAIMQVLLAQKDFMQLAVDKSARNITISIDRSKLNSHALPAISEMLLRLHIYRCTADFKAAETYFGDLSKVECNWLEIREIVVEHMQQEPARIFVQANTYMDEYRQVHVKEYDATVEGVIQSWVDRNI